MLTRPFSFICLRSKSRTCHRQEGREGPHSLCRPGVSITTPLWQWWGGGSWGRSWSAGLPRPLGWEGKRNSSPVAAVQALEGLQQPQLRVRERPQLLKGSEVHLLLLFFPFRRPQSQHGR